MVVPEQRGVRRQLNGILIDGGGQQGVVDLDHHVDAPAMALAFGSPPGKGRLQCEGIGGTVPHQTHAAIVCRWPRPTARSEGKTRAVGHVEPTSFWEGNKRYD